MQALLIRGAEIRQSNECACVKGVGHLQVDHVSFG